MIFVYSLLLGLVHCEKDCVQAQNNVALRVTCVEKHSQYLIQIPFKVFGR